MEANSVTEVNGKSDVETTEWTKEQEVCLFPKEFIYREIDDEGNLSDDAPST